MRPRLVRRADAARVGLTDDEYWTDSQRVLDAAYLAAVTPEGGSGFGGSAQDWHDERSVLLDAVDRDGSFLDVGCANGLLMESLARWSDARGVRLEPYGLDISEPLAALARRRLPQWADRIWTGNALEWVPPNGQQFDYVHTLLETVPAHRHADAGRPPARHRGRARRPAAREPLRRRGGPEGGRDPRPTRVRGGRRDPSARARRRPAPPPERLDRQVTERGGRQIVRRVKTRPLKSDEYVCENKERSSPRRTGWPPSARSTTARAVRWRVRSRSCSSASSSPRS